MYDSCTTLYRITEYHPRRVDKFRQMHASKSGRTVFFIILAIILLILWFVFIVVQFQQYFPMLTPEFELSQDEKFVFVYMKTPYIKVGCNWTMRNNL